MKSVQRKSTRKRGSESGVSIIEMMIVATILLIFVGGAIGLLSQLITSTSISAEKQDLEKEKETLGTMIRPDFENAGFGVADFENHNYGSAPAAFKSNNEYQALGNGDIIRFREGAATIGSLTQIGSETGSVKVTMYGESRISLEGAESGDASLEVEIVGEAGYQLYAASGAERVNLGLHSPGTSYRIGVVPSTSGKAVVITRLLAENPAGNVELGRITEGVPQGTIKVTAFIKIINERMQVVMTGSPLIQTDSSTSLNTVLFIDSKLGGRVESAIYRNPNDLSVTLVRGDGTVGLSYLKQSVNDLTGQTQITVSESEKDPLKVNDYCLLINYGSKISALLRIDDIDSTTPNSRILTVSPVRVADSAWGRFYAPEETLIEVYGEGSKLVKLNPPITYRIAEDKRLIREVNGAAETAAFKVKSFGMTIVAGKSAGEIQYEIEVALAADGRETSTVEGVPIVRFIYRATPKALNVANQTE